MSDTKTDNDSSPRAAADQSDERYEFGYHLYHKFICNDEIGLSTIVAAKTYNGCQLVFHRTYNTATRQDAGLCVQLMFSNDDIELSNTRSPVWGVPTTERYRSVFMMLFRRRIDIPDQKVEFLTAESAPAEILEVCIQKCIADGESVTSKFAALFTTTD